jgi:hypothetical protein
LRTRSRTHDLFDEPVVTLGADVGDPGGELVRLVIARCTVDYLGRLTAHLPSARRLLLIKADGSVSAHADDRAYKPLNWMSPPCWLTEASDGSTPVWVVENKIGEQLRITIEEIEHDSSHELGIDPGLVKDGVEAHLQELLAEHVELGTQVVRERDRRCPRLPGAAPSIHYRAQRAASGAGARPGRGQDRQRVAVG